MDWALGIVWRNNRIFGEFIDAAGKRELAEVDVMVSRGIPDDTSFKSGRFDSNFSDWQEISADGYLTAFGLESASLVGKNHSVYYASAGKLKLTIPALVLMRALFRPNKFMLPRVFRPHFLNLCSHFDSSHESPRLLLDVPRGINGLGSKESAEFEQAIAWMRCYPSAWNMAGSIHAHAREGEICMKLPIGKVRYSISGKRIDNIVYVTKMHILAITTDENPAFNCKQLDKIISFGKRRISGKNGMLPGTHISWNVPRHSDGSTQLSNDEWRAVEPILHKKIRGSTKHSQRELLNGILLKLSSGLPWRDIPCEVGNWSNVTEAYRRWNKQGELESALEQLKRMRQSHPAKDPLTMCVNDFSKTMGN